MTTQLFTYNGSVYTYSPKTGLCILTQSKSGDLFSVSVPTKSEAQARSNGDIISALDAGNVTMIHTYHTDRVLA